MTINWRDVPEEDPTDDDEDVPCPGWVRTALGFDPDEQPVVNAVEDEPRDAAGRWVAKGWGETTKGVHTNGIYRAMTGGSWKEKDKVGLYRFYELVGEYNSLTDAQAAAEKDASSPEAKEAAAKDQAARDATRKYQERYASQVTEQEPSDPVPSHIHDTGDRVLKTLTPAERSAVTAYTDAGSSELNAAVRESPDLKGLSMSQQKTMKLLESAIAKSGEFKEPVTLYRGINLEKSAAEAMIAEFRSAGKAGAPITMPGVKSTSLAKEIAFDGFSGGVKFTIKAKTGLFVDPISSYHEEPEYEVLQSHHTQYRLVKISGSHKSGFNIHLEELEKPTRNSVEDEPRGPDGRWMNDGDIPAALRPKLKSGTYPKSAELHAAAADSAKLEALFKAVRREDRGKLTRLMVTLQSAAKLRERAKTPVSKEVDIEQVHTAVKRLAGSVNLASLPKVRAALAHLDREQQDAALMELHRHGKIGFSGWEGRQGITAAEKAALLDVGGQQMGHVYVRNTFCPTGEGGGVDPSCGKGESRSGSISSMLKLLSKKDDYSNRIEGTAEESIRSYMRSRVNGWIDSAGLDGDKAEDYRKSLEAALRRMSGRALDRLQANVDRIRFLDSMQEMKEYDQKVSKTSINWETQETGGLWVTLPSGKGEMAVNGPHSWSESKEEDMRGIHAHELGHAVDGVRCVYTSQEEWRDAWMKEIRRHDNPLSRYAKETEQEGFAEFARVLWSGDKDRAAIKKRFPDCWDFWEKRGLV